MIEPLTVLVERYPPLQDWKIVAEVRQEAIYVSPSDPLIIVLQHRATRELRVDVYGCDDGIDVTFTNGGTNDPRARWFRDFRMNRTSLQPIRVRLLGSNLELRS